MVLGRGAVGALLTRADPAGCPFMAFRRAARWSANDVTAPLVRCEIGARVAEATDGSALADGSVVAGSELPDEWFDSAAEFSLRGLLVELTRPAVDACVCASVTAVASTPVGGWVPSVVMFSGADSMLRVVKSDSAGVDAVAPDSALGCAWPFRSLTAPMWSVRPTTARCTDSATVSRPSTFGAAAVWEWSALRVTPS